jgi:hypothetical protein
MTARPVYREIDLGVSFELGVITAMIALPAVLALTLGIGFPLFRYYVRRGYSSVAAYVGGGIVIALVGASLIAIAHSATDFLASSDVAFAFLLLAVCGPVGGVVVWWVLRRSDSEHLTT